MVKHFEFEIQGMSDSDYAKDPVTRRSVSGWVAMLNGAPYVRKSKMQKFVTLSVTEAECVAATSCVQDMIYGRNFLESLGLKVKKPMTLWIDNKGAVDIFNNLEYCRQHSCSVDPICLHSRVEGSWRIGNQVDKHHG